MADRQRPFIRVLSPRIQMRISRGMEKEPSRTDAVRGGSEMVKLDSTLTDRLGTRSSNLTTIVYHIERARTAAPVSSRN